MFIYLCILSPRPCHHIQFVRRRRRRRRRSFTLLAIGVRPTDQPTARPPPHNLMNRIHHWTISMYRLHVSFPTIGRADHWAFHCCEYIVVFRFVYLNTYSFAACFFFPRGPLSRSLVVSAATAAVGFTHGMELMKEGRCSAAVSNTSYPCLCATQIYILHRTFSYIYIGA